MNLRKDHYRVSYHTNLSLKSPRDLSGRRTRAGRAVRPVLRDGRRGGRGLMDPILKSGGVRPPGLPESSACDEPFVATGFGRSCRGACSRSCSCGIGREQWKGWAGGPFRRMARLKESCLPPPARGTALCHSARPPRQNYFHFFFHYSLLTVGGASAPPGLSSRLLRTAALRP